GALEKEDEFVWGGVNVGGQESAGRKGRVPGKRALAHRLRHVGLAHNIPDDAIKAGAGFGYSRHELLHRVSSLVTCKRHCDLNGADVVVAIAAASQGAGQGYKAIAWITHDNSPPVLRRTRAAIKTFTESQNPLMPALLFQERNIPIT